MEQLKTISDRVGEIATEADGTTSPSTLQTYADEVNQLIQQAAEAANTKNGDQYLFGGTSNSQAPFTVTTDASGNVTAVTYAGNTSVAQTEVSQGVTATADIPGANTTGSGARGLLVDSRYGADFFNHLIAFAQDLRNGDTTAITSTDAPALTKDEDNIIYQVANIGVTQTRLASAATAISNQQSAVSTSFSNVAGTDMTQAITDLSQAQTTYTAALQSSSILLQLQGTVLQYL